MNRLFLVRVAKCDTTRSKVKALEEIQQSLRFKHEQFFSKPNLEKCPIAKYLKTTTKLKDDTSILKHQELYV